jgi:hypothetical protein
MAAHQMLGLLRLELALLMIDHFQQACNDNTNRLYFHIDYQISVKCES